MLLHHVSVGTNDIQKSRRFYDPIMKHLGLRVLYETDKAVDYGVSDILFGVETPHDGQPATAGNGVHFCFSTVSRPMVDEFYKIGLENGGTSDGPPGIREQYDKHYYAAFLLDPDGNKIEALCLYSK